MPAGLELVRAAAAEFSITLYSYSTVLGRVGALSFTFMTATRTVVDPVRGEAPVSRASTWFYQNNEYKT